MHELSIVMSIVDIATQQARKAEAERVDEIELDIGELSGVEMNAFDFAWEQGIKDSLLKDAERIVNRVNGVGMCMDCGIDFHMQNLYDSCPVCDGHFIEIKKGKELKVKSLVVS
ncbi:MAG: hydrogenase maturation nickel metallochaperone HypA [Chitinophagaceae bacterium]